MKKLYIIPENPFSNVKINTVELQIWMNISTNILGPLISQSFS